MAVTNGIVPASRRAGQRETGRCSGFTILEILIAIAILAIVMGIVYTMFSSVSNSVENLRSKRPEVQQINFLLRRLTENLAAAFLVYDLTNQAVFFVGEDKESDEQEHADSVRFFSTAAPLSGSAVGGGLKEVSYIMSGPGLDDEEGLFRDEGDEEGPLTLAVTERPILSPRPESDEEREYDDRDMGLDEDDELGFDEESSWMVELGSFNLQYFDGIDWVDEWDSNVTGLLPWAVKIEAYFPESVWAEEGERLELGSTDTEMLADFSTIVVLPLGVGITPETAEVFAARGIGPVGGFAMLGQPGVTDLGARPGRRTGGERSRRVRPR